MARFAMTFQAAGRNVQPLATIDPAAAIADAARLAAIALAAQFARGFGP